jgi:transcription antitermination factor NusG
MQTRQIRTKDWGLKLNLVSRKLADRYVNIEVIGKDIGDQFVAKSQHLKGLSYDPHGQQVEISSDNFNHTIPSPAEIYFTSEEENLETIQSIEFVDNKKRQHIVTFDAPLLLSN